jgi:protoheme IX farnesyltransferase
MNEGARKASIAEYYKLAKPGIIYGNVLTTVAAFLFAWRWHFNSSALFEHFIFLFIATNLGIAFVIGSACVFNNYLDRTIDKRMSRTKNRALVTGIISVRSALIYGAILGIVGVALLYLFVNLLTALIAVLGFVSYVVIYGIAKRESHWGAVVGSVPGAVPIVVGYTAVTNHLDGAALILFLVLVTWQMPHFYAIAMFRLEEYKAAGIPVLPAVKGMKATKVHILLYIIAFIIATALLTLCGYAGLVYLIVLLVVGFIWLWRALQGFKSKDSANAISTAERDAKWARKLFRFSLIVLLVFCVALAVAPLLP